MARGLQTGSRVRDVRTSTSGRGGLIIAFHGQGRARKWEVQWDTGALEQVAARSLAVEGAGGSGVHAPLTTTTGESGPADSQLSENEEEGSSSSETEGNESGDDGTSENADSAEEEEEGGEQDAPAEG